jgi:hypothetical protein
MRQRLARLGQRGRGQKKTGGEEETASHMEALGQ